MRVPSALDELVCVAGVDAKHTSPPGRAPPAGRRRPMRGPPRAHRKRPQRIGSTSTRWRERGPRGAADAAHVLTTHSGLKPTDLVIQLLGSNNTSGWDASTGYGSNTCGGPVVRGAGAVSAPRPH